MHESIDFYQHAGDVIAQGDTDAEVLDLEGVAVDR